MNLESIFRYLIPSLMIISTVQLTPINGENGDPKSFSIREILTVDTLADWEQFEIETGARSACVYSEDVEDSVCFINATATGRTGLWTACQKSECQMSIPRNEQNNFTQITVSGYSIICVYNYIEGIIAKTYCALPQNKYNWNTLTVYLTGEEGKIDEFRIDLFYYWTDSFCIMDNFSVTRDPMLVPTTPSLPFYCKHADGLFQDTRNCRGFYQCFNWHAEHFCCTEDLYYNEVIEACDYPENIECTVPSPPCA